MINFIKDALEFVACQPRPPIGLLTEEMGKFELIFIQFYRNLIFWLRLSLDLLGVGIIATLGLVTISSLTTGNFSILKLMTSGAFMLTITTLVVSVLIAMSTIITLLEYSIGRETNLIENNV